MAAVLLFDTSPSMEYTSGGLSRLEEARQRARELIGEMNGNSEVAILDAGDETGDSFLNPAQALARLDGLAIRPGSSAVNHALERATRLLEQVRQREEPLPSFVYLFSDRTRACWDPALATRPGGALALPKDVSVRFVDVGVESPIDQAIRRIEVDPPVVAPGALMEVRVTVQGFGPEQENQLSLSIDNDREASRPILPRPIRLPAGPSTTVMTFEGIVAPRPEEGAAADVPFQLTARLGTSDNLPFNNVRHATFLVRAGRRLLTITEPGVKKFPWQIALDVVGSFRCDVRSREEADRLGAGDLAAYRVIALHQLRHLDEGLAGKLAEHVRGGGGLAVIPPGDEMTDTERTAFNRVAKNLLPAPLERLVSAPKDGYVLWAPFAGDHPLTAAFQRWGQSADPDFDRPTRRPLVRRYWELGPLAPGALALARYLDGGKAPGRLALAERAVGTGRVLLFTTPLDARPLERGRDAVGWHNYWQDSSFGLVLVDRACRDLAGDVEAPEVNYLCGRLPQVVLPAPLHPPYAVQGPELAAAEANLTVAAGPAGGTGVLQVVPQAVQPGNYLVSDGGGRRVAGFSLDVRGEESDLDRVPVAEIEGVLGAGSVVPLGRGVRLADAVRGNQPAPFELLPLLMMALLLILTLESLLATWFYRPSAAGTGPAPREPATTPVVPPPLPAVESPALRAEPVRPAPRGEGSGTREKLPS